MKISLVLLLLVALFALSRVPAWSRRRRRKRLFGTPLPEKQRRILEQNLPIFRRMPPDLREQLARHVNVFLDEKHFLGCGGLTLTEEMQVTIAGHACLLLLNRERPRYFPGFTSILVYPDTFLVDDVEYDGEIEIHGQDARAGESWHGGPVILSWSDILPGISGEPDGQNVILHEFAHKLDEEEPDGEGLPVLDSAEHYREWKAVFTRAWDTLEETLERLHDPAIDDYALTSPAEFFAVATEGFFESPVRMQRQFPEVYAELAKLYRVDPAAWFAGEEPARPRQGSRARALERR